MTQPSIGEVTDVRPLAAMFNGAVWLQFLHMWIATFMVTGFVVAAVYARGMLVGRNDHHHRLGFTVPFVLYGIFRYFYLVHMRGEGGRPSRELVNDKPLLINILLYGISVLLILYVKP